MTIDVTLSLRQRAQAAYEAEQRDAEARQQKSDAHDALALQKALKRVLDIEAEPTGPSIEIDGFTLQLRRSGFDEQSGWLSLVWTCPDCDGIDYEDILDLADLGSALNRGGPEYSNHYCAKPAPAPVTESNDAAQRLLEALDTYIIMRAGGAY